MWINIKHVPQAKNGKWKVKDIMLKNITIRSIHSYFILKKLATKTKVRAAKNLSKRVSDSATNIYLKAGMFGWKVKYDLD